MFRRITPFFLLIMTSLPAYSGDFIGEISQAVSTPLELTQEPCSSQAINEADAEGFQVFCGSSPFKFKEFRKRWKAFMKSRPDFERSEINRWTRGEDLSHYRFWYRDMSGVLAMFDESRQVQVLIRNVMAACSTPEPAPPEGENVIPPVATSLGRKIYQPDDPVPDDNPSLRPSVFLGFVYYQDEPDPDDNGIRVRVRVHINEDGTQSALCIVDPDPKVRKYNDFAIDLALRSSYQPAIRNGEPIPMEVEVTVFFPSPPHKTRYTPMEER